ncbi:S8 family serine peptidase [Priestia megaterium]|uniref:S8 family serine peptidase n=1 Tax=Priestia megaterium TaxID=1404 RepID=UPI0039FDA5D7
MTLLQLNALEFTKNTQIIIKFKERVCEETQLEIHYKNKCRILDHNKELNFQVLHSKTDINTLIKIYNKLEEVEYAEPNHMLKAFYTPKDLFSPISMALKKYKLLLLGMLRPVMKI